MGSEAKIDMRPSSVWLREKTAKWPWKTHLRVGAKRDEALEILSSEGTLLVLCSLVDNMPYVVAEAAVSVLPKILVSMACQQWLSLAAEAIFVDAILNVLPEAIMAALQRILACPMLVELCKSVCLKHGLSFLECLDLRRISLKSGSFLLSFTAAHCRQKVDCAQSATSHNI